ncbi:MAG: HDIG domain-containing protein [bacterium]|nr:HDIG domain-containing protein [bacterium]
MKKIKLKREKQVRPRKPILRGFIKKTRSYSSEDDSKNQQQHFSLKAKIVAVLVGSFLALLFLLIPDFLFVPYPTELNMIPEKDIRAPFSLSVVDQEETNRKRAELYPQLPLILVEDTQGTQRILNELYTIYSTAQQISRIPGLSTIDKIESVKKQISFPISDNAIATLLRYAHYRNLNEITKKIVAEVMSTYTLSAEDFEFAQRSRNLLVYSDTTKQEYPVHIENIVEFSEAKKKSLRRLSTLLPNEEDRGLRKALNELFHHVLYPSLKVDKEKTAAYLAKLEPTLPIEKIVKRRGDIIVQAKHPITAKDKIILEELNRIRVRAAIGIMLGRAILLILFAYFTLVYLRIYYPKIIQDFYTIAPACLLWVITVAIARIVVWFGGSAYLVPVGAFAMLAGIMFEIRFALLMVTSIAVLLGIMVGLEVKHVLVFLLSGMIATLTLSHLKKRTDLIRAGLRISAINFVGIIVLFLFDQSMFSPANWNTAELLLDSFSGLANGILCYILTISFLPGFERLFNLTTDWKLLEFSDTKSELLTRLETEAPGTYQHSLSVSALADSAASAIGANALLCRIAAYYHDIGKLMKPEYFSENQLTEEEKRKHGKLSPYMSALIIKNHVKHGVELAKEHRLPPPIIDIIEQHHGTTLIAYFYQEALEMHEMTENGEELDESHFRYPGPKPQTIESAIILLADAVEAATASLENPTEKEIHLLVRKLVNDRFTDEQLEECELTLRDLHLITESFVRSLLLKYHRRIEYPETAEFVESP